MCINCAFSLEDGVNQCMECDICIRNPKNVSVRFQPITYKEHKIEKPIDMYISRELMAILRYELKKIYEEGLKRGEPYIPANTPDVIPLTWWWSQTKQSFVTQRTYNSVNTLSITYILSIPTEVEDPNKEVSLPILGDSSNKKVIKTVCIDIEEILEAMEGMEVEAN